MKETPGNSNPVQDRSVRKVSLREVSRNVCIPSREPRHRKPAFLRLAFTEATTLLNFPFCKVPSAVCSLTRPGVLACEPSSSSEPAHFDVKEVNCERNSGQNSPRKEILLTDGERERSLSSRNRIVLVVLAALSRVHQRRMSAHVVSELLRSTASHRVNTSRGDPLPFYAKLGCFSSLWQRSCCALSPIQTRVPYCRQAGRPAAKCAFPLNFSPFGEGKFGSAVKGKLKCYATLRWFTRLDRRATM